MKKFLHGFLSRERTDKRFDTETIRLEEQYAADHLAYKLAHGEINLLRDFIICRNRRRSRITVIPLNTIEKVEERFRRVGNRSVPHITFVLDTGKRVPVEFSVRNYQDGEQVINWLIGKIGAEKVERGADKPSILWKGSYFTGILGAFLGMLLSLFLFWTVGLVYLTASMIVLPFIAPIIIAGYCWCRGRRNLCFAYVVTGIFTLLTCLIYPIVPMVSEYGFGIFVILFRSEYWVYAWFSCMLSCGMAMFVFWRLYGKLHAYVEPAFRPWFESREHIAMLPNPCPQQLLVREVPSQFSVGNALTVKGEILHTIPGIRRGKKFSVEEIAGVMLGNHKGCNVLYNKDFQVLSKFTWSMNGSDLLVFYLFAHGIPFDHLPPQLQCYLEQQKDMSVQQCSTSEL